LGVAASKPLAGFILLRRSWQRADLGGLWLAYDATANLGIGLRVGRGHGFCFRLGFGEGVRLRPLENRIENLPIAKVEPPSVCHFLRRSREILRPAIESQAAVRVFRGSTRHLCVSAISPDGVFTPCHSPMRQDTIAVIWQNADFQIMTPIQPLPAASLGQNIATAKLEAVITSGECRVQIGGDWRLNERVPSWNRVIQNQMALNVRVVCDDLGKWDTSLVLFLVHGRAWCAASKKEFHAEALPENLQALLRQVPLNSAAKPATKAAVKPWELASNVAKKWSHHAQQSISFLGECTLGFMGVAKNPRRFRWLDCLVEMQKCWASSLPMVSLVSFLVGVILAFQSAVQLQQFGAAIYVADLVGLSVVRELGPMMAAFIVAGGTGARFAAQIGNMKVDDEIDALETVGISSVNFLALPRLLAVTVMMPILALYANVLGVLGGMFVSATMLNIPASAYWIETQNRVGFADVSSGLFKCLFFGLAVGLAGCLRGIKCERSAAGVGTATSSAVVTGIMLIVLADALFAVIYNVLGI
jgi:phospholipid/cholesterol/gamma-HCH transport system permease protein